MSDAEPCPAGDADVRESVDMPGRVTRSSLARQYEVRRLLRASLCADCHHHVAIHRYGPCVGYRINFDTDEGSECGCATFRDASSEQTGEPE